MSPLSSRTSAGLSSRRRAAATRLKPRPRDGSGAPRLQPVSAGQVALIPRCAECLVVWLPGDEERWRAYLNTDDELVFYCPEWADREFGQLIS